MKESKTECPSCARPPGGEHRDECYRSRVSRKKAGKRARREPRLLWAKGATSLRKEGSEPVMIYNPGVPFVKPPKDWFAGGLPGGGGPDNMSPPVRDFIDKITQVVKGAS